MSAIRFSIVPGLEADRVLLHNCPFQEYFGLHASRGPVEDPAWYAGTRDYQGNRPARNIHWKASARLGVLQEKLYEPTSHRKVLFVLDVHDFGSNTMVSRPEGGNHEPSHADLETSIEVVASMASNLMKSGVSVGSAPDGSFPSGSSLWCGFPAFLTNEVIDVR